MYFNGKLEIDPSQITIFKKVKPTKLFGKLVDALTFGTLTEKQEHETFTAVAILQQMNMGLRSIRVKNVIRLAVDDYDFYLDKKGVDDDLEQAMFEFKAKVDPLESELFNVIYLVLEHEDDYLKYLIEISIQRKHKIGEYPIIINVNGVLKNFKYSKSQTDPNRLRAKMKELFKDQKKYDSFVNEKKIIFDNFIDKLNQGIRKFVRMDDVKKKTNAQIFRPKQKIEKPEQISHGKYAEPIYYGYYGINDFFFYTTMWAGLMYSHNIYCHNCTVVDGAGSPVMEVGDQGFNAGESDALNVEAPFEPPAEGDIQYFGDNEFSDKLEQANLVEKTEGEEPVSEEQVQDESWLDSAGTGDEASFASCSSCGSCGSCSACGGCT